MDQQTPFENETQEQNAAQGDLHFHTLDDRIREYCTKHVKEMPYGQHLMLLGQVVRDKVKELGKYELITKVETAMVVNAYPDELLPVLDEVIETYFSDRHSFYTESKGNAKKRVRFFNYQVELHKAEAFEAALKDCGMPVQRNDENRGVAQYAIPVSNPAHLVKLGKVFQKQRWLQENRIKRERYQSSKPVS